MKCRAARAWMLAAETPQRPPPPVRRHLQSCRRCRRRFARLLRLLHAVEQAPLPPLDAGVRATILDQLPPPPVAPAPAPPEPVSGPRRRARPWQVATAAALVLAAGAVWLALATRDPGRRTVPPPPRPPTALPPPTLEDRVLEQHLRLAESREPAEQLDALTRIAADLRAESLLQARTRAAEAEDLRLLSWLHGRVARDGIVPLARGLPAPERGRLPP